MVMRSPFEEPLPHAEAQDVTLARGVVALADGARLSVSVEGRANVIAERAASCLLQPEPEDEVLVAIDRKCAFVLAVLRRREGTAARLVTEGDVELVARDGTLSIVGQHGVRLTSPESVGIVADGLDAHVSTVVLSFQTLALLGKSVSAKLGVIKTCADAIETIAERAAERVTRAYRFVEERDQVRAGVIDHRAENMLSLRAEHAVVAARKIVKIDGEQMHFG